MFKFYLGVRKLPFLWQIWLLVLIVINGILPFFFLNESLSIVAITAMLTGAIIGFVLTETQGFTKLLGIMHGPWVPMFILQILTLREGNTVGNFDLWLKSSIVVTALSLIIDIIDVIKYLKGNKTDLLKSSHE